MDLEYLMKHLEQDTYNVQFYHNHLLATWENGGLSVCGVHRRQKPGTKSREDDAHIEFKDATDGSRKKDSRWSLAATLS